MNCDGIFCQFFVWMAFIGLFWDIFHLGGLVRRKVIWILLGKSSRTNFIDFVCHFKGNSAERSAGSYLKLNSCFGQRFDLISIFLLQIFFFYFSLGFLSWYFPLGPRFRQILPLFMGIRLFCLFTPGSIVGVLVHIVFTWILTVILQIFNRFSIKFEFKVSLAAPLTSHLIEVFIKHGIWFFLLEKVFRIFRMDHIL